MFLHKQAGSGRPNFWTYESPAAGSIVASAPATTGGTIYPLSPPYMAYNPNVTYNSSKAMNWSGDWTIELALINPTTTSGSSNWNGVFQVGSGTSSLVLQLFSSTSLTLTFRNATQSMATSLAGYPLTWLKIVIMQSGSTTYMYVNGSQVASSAFSADPDTLTGSAFILGAAPQYWTGKVLGCYDNIRISNIARYTPGGRITVPDTLTLDSNCWFYTSFTNTWLPDTGMI